MSIPDTYEVLTVKTEFDEEDQIEIFTFRNLHEAKRSIQSLVPKLALKTSHILITTTTQISVDDYLQLYKMLSSKTSKLLGYHMRLISGVIQIY